MFYLFNIYAQYFGCRPLQLSMSVLSLALNTLNAIDSLEQGAVYHVCKVARHDGILRLPGLNILATREIDNVLCMFIKWTGLYTPPGLFINNVNPGGAIQNITE